jgi:hypothetical protein
MNWNLTREEILAEIDILEAQIRDDERWMNENHWHLDKRGRHDWYDIMQGRRDKIFKLKTLLGEL